MTQAAAENVSEVARQVALNVQPWRAMRYFLLTFLAACGIAKAQSVSFLRPVIAYQSGASRGASICENCVSVGDFNGDGKSDIAYAVTEFSPFAGVVLGNGDGTFRPGTEFFPNQALGRPWVADFNGDGKMDVVISGTQTWIHLGNGDGTFADQMPVGGCAASGGYALNAIGDFNRDGKVDLFCGTSVLLSNGDGTFRSGGTVDVKLGEVGLLAADFNGDGKPDLLLLQLSGQLAIAFGNGDGTFRPDVVIATQLLVSDGVLVGDFTGDGVLDLAGYAVGKGPWYLNVLPGKGDGTFGAAIQTALPSGPPGAVTATADFNGDGRLDVVAGDAVLVGNGDGTFRYPVFFGTVTSACGAAAAPTIPDFYPCSSSHNATAIADLNGDGKPDIVAGTVVFGPQSSAFSVVTVLLNDGTGNGFTATGVSSASLGWPVAPGSIASAFGTNLAMTTAAAASGSSFPTTLAGVRVHVQDRSHVGDMLAPLLFVSPGQINYIMPSSDPFAYVAIEQVGSAYVPKGMAVPIAPIVPGLFPAWNAVRVNSNGSLTYLPVNPIDLSGDAPVYLVLYGTGFAAASVGSSSCSVGGQTLALSYAGPEMAVAGLDQANVLLQKSLVGAGAVQVNCLMFGNGLGGGITNTLQIAIQ